MFDNQYLFSRPTHNEPLTYTIAAYVISQDCAVEKTPSFLWKVIYLLDIYSKAYISFGWISSLIRVIYVSSNEDPILLKVQ